MGANGSSITVDQALLKAKGKTMGKRDELWERYMESRDPALREEIILQNVPLVRHILGRLAIPVISNEIYTDLMGQGILGLIDAVDRFEPSRGWRFSTYATLRIRGHIIDALRAMDMLPRGARKRVKEIEHAVSRLRMELCREPEDEEVAAAVHMDLPSYRSALIEANCTIFSLETAIDGSRNDQELNYRDLLCDEDAPDPEESLEEVELYERLAGALQQLPRRLQVLLSLYYYEGLTMKEIGQVLDLSESRVSQLHARAVKRLQTALEPEAAPAREPIPVRVPQPSAMPVFAAA
jgi:RNA polymerase sigma factor for flagellar operon FliA